MCAGMRAGACVPACARGRHTLSEISMASFILSTNLRAPISLACRAPESARTCVHMHPSGAQTHAAAHDPKIDVLHLVCMNL